jgi:hypothetical protein
MHLRYRIVVLGFAALMAANASQVAATQQSASGAPLAAVMQPITAVLNAANTGNFKLLHIQYAPNSTIADEFAPFEWTGANAQDRWFADFGKAAGELKMTQIKLVPGAPTYHYLAGTRAYVVVPATVSANIAGKPYTESGTLAFTLRQRGAVWKISGQTWAKGPEAFNPY